MEILKPRPLVRGDRVAILSPASIIKPQTVYEAMPVLADHGWTVYAGEHTFDRYGTYAGTDEARYADLETALLDPDTRAIICARGGYGAVHLLERLSRLPLRDDPKWIVGYSDISALHALMSANGIESIHAPMCKHIAKYKGRDADTRRLFDLLEGHNPEVTLPGHRLNRPGAAKGPLLGGNLAEPIYKVERMFYTLRLSGVLGQLGGLIVGRFTDYTPDRDNESMEAMIDRVTEGYDYPIAYGAPIGHVDHNIPMLCSSLATLTVTPGSARLTQA